MKKTAAGWGALIHSGKAILQEKGGPDTARALLRVNQPDGFDCPGCAWPEPTQTSKTEFCENGVKAVAAETTSKQVTPKFFSKHSVSSLLEQTDHWLESQGRLTHPMQYDPVIDHYKPVAWEEAFRIIGDSLNRLDHADEAIFYTSGRTSNEAAFLYQLLGREFGTNNFPDCSNMCHESSGVALTEAIGIGKGTVTLHDFEQADSIFIIGQNPGTNHPRMLSTLQRASVRGAKIITCNPLVERGLERFTHPQDPWAMLTLQSTPISSLYVQPLVGGDLAMLKGVIKAVLEAESHNPGQVLDHDFIQRHTSGWEELQADISEVGWSLIEEESGLARNILEEMANIYIQSENVIVCWAMGLTQNKYAVSTIQYVVNLLLLRGNLGRAGAGVCPVRGHSNVQGDRTVGINDHPPESFLMKLDEVFGIQAPRKHGYNTVQAIQAMVAGEALVFIGMGGNFVRATPDTEATELALRSCELTVQISTKLNRSHLIHGKQALILPCLGRSEVDRQAVGVQRVTVEDSMSMVHASLGQKKPASPHLQSEPAIVAGIAKTTLSKSKIDWDWLVADYDRIRDRIADVLPSFQNYNEKIQRPGGFRLRNSASLREWKTPTGKANFLTFPLPRMALPEGQLRLMTVRSHDQYNTTIYGLDDRYRGVFGTRKVIFMNPDDMKDQGLRQGDCVDLESHAEEALKTQNLNNKQSITANRALGDSLRTRWARGFVVVKYNIPKGCAASYFPETNCLVPLESYADKSWTPTSKFIAIRVHKQSATLGQ